jgi:predicted O-methyltransferase YrrM
MPNCGAPHKMHAGILHHVTTDFASAWTLADPVPGWLTRDQGRALWNAAAAIPATGTIVEIGSHQGRSTVILGCSAIATGARVIAIDPFVGRRLFGGVVTRDRFEQNISAAGLDGVVRLIAEPSAALRPSWSEPLAMVYIDGKHDFWTARDDLRWAEHLTAGAPLLMHDAFSSVGVTLAIVLHVLPGRSLRYLGRTGSLARFEAGSPGSADRLRIVRELPWFVRNVLIKLALRIARLFGNSRPDPY